MRGSASFTNALLGASLAHAACAVALFAWAARPTTRSTPASSAPFEVEVEPEPPPSVTAAPEPHDAPAAARVAMAATTRAPSAPSSRTPEPSVLDAPKGSDATWSFSPLAPEPSAGPAAPGALDAATRSAVADAVARDAARSDKVARDALLAPAGDAYLSGAAGVLVPLTRRVVRGSRAPLRGSARLALAIDAAGLVASVHVLDASSEWASWSDVATEIATEAHAHVVPVPSGARGVALTLDVVSYVASPSGVAGPNEVVASSPLQERWDQAELHRGARPVDPRAPQSRKLDLVIGPNAIDLTVHQGVGDLVTDTALADRRVVAVRVVDEHTL